MTLTNDLEIKIGEIRSLLDVIEKQAREDQKWHDQLQEYDRSLKHYKEDIVAQQKEIAKKELQNEGEREHLIRKNRELIIKEKDIESAFNRLAEKKKEMDELDTKKQELIDQQHKLDEKLLLMKEIDEKLADIEERENRLIKEKAVERERKEALDIQEEKNRREAERLERIALKYQV